MHDTIVSSFGVISFFNQMNHCRIRL